MHRAFRIKNLIIILLTQWAVWYMVFDKNSDVVRIPSAMSYLDIIILGIITTMLAIGAYLINDVYDLEADKHNGIERVEGQAKNVTYVLAGQWYRSDTICICSIENTESRFTMDIPIGCISTLSI